MQGIVVIAALVAVGYGFATAGLAGALTGFVASVGAGSGLAIAVAQKETTLHKSRSKRTAQRLGGIFAAAACLGGAYYGGWTLGWLWGAAGYALGALATLVVAVAVGDLKSSPGQSARMTTNSTPPAPSSATGGRFPSRPLPPDDPIYSKGWLILPMIRGRKPTRPPEVASPEQPPKEREGRGQEAREGASAISRAQAQQIARDYATARGRPIIADEVVVLDLDDLDRRGVRRPVVYAVDLRDAWIVYALEERPMIRSSTIVAVSRTTGQVLYYGSANDEG